METETTLPQAEQGLSAPGFDKERKAQFEPCVVRFVQVPIYQCINFNERLCLENRTFVGVTGCCSSRPRLQLSLDSWRGQFRHRCKQCLLHRSYGLDVQGIALAFAGKEIFLANAIPFQPKLAGLSTLTQLLRKH